MLHWVSYVEFPNMIKIHFIYLQRLLDNANSKNEQYKLQIKLY